MSSHSHSPSHPPEQPAGAPQCLEKEVYVLCLHDSILNQKSLETPKGSKVLKLTSEKCPNDGSLVTMCLKDRSHHFQYRFPHQSTRALEPPRHLKDCPQGCPEKHSSQHRLGPQKPVFISNFLWLIINFCDTLPTIHWHKNNGLGFNWKCHLYH